MMCGNAHDDHISYTTSLLHAGIELQYYHLGYISKHITPNRVIFILYFEVAEEMLHPV